VNLFVVARRIALVISAIFVIGAVVKACFYRPYIVAKYTVADFNAPPAKTGQCRISTDKVLYRMLQTPSGITFNLNLCFVAQFSEKEKDYFIPYKKTAESSWGTSKHSIEAQEYVDNYFQNIFELSSTDFAEIEAEYFLKKWFEIAYTICYLLVGLVIFRTFVSIIGLIVRRLVRIPRGQDRKPSTKLSATTVATD
jgi:hypothetical protein